MNIAGRIVCDSCGTDCGNGSLYDALVMSDVVDGVVETYHFCRDRDDPQNPGGTLEGCAKQVKRPEVLRDYLARNAARDGTPWSAVTPQPVAPPVEPVAEPAT